VAAGRPLISIVIPVFNQRDELLFCLRALARQTLDAARFEVLVVDNNSNPPVDDLAEAFPFVRRLHEPTPGSYAARNRGIEAARADLLAFTDADCVPAGDWIECGIDALRRLPGAGMVGGRIDLTFEDPASPTAAELYDAVFGFPQQRFVQWGFAATANVFTTRETMALVGMFSDGLMSGGDMEWGQRVQARGLRQEYADHVRVAHPARRGLRQLWLKILRVAGGNQQLAERRGEGTAGLLAYAWQQLVQLRRIRANVYDDRLDSRARQVKFAAVVWSIDLLRTIERYRVHFGGSPRRT
jgi:glycosyltransferase involved in cell wall biosynthesis